MVLISPALNAYVISAIDMDCPVMSVASLVERHTQPIFGVTNKQLAIIQSTLDQFREIDSWMMRHGSPPPPLGGV